MCNEKQRSVQRLLYIAFLHCLLKLDRFCRVNIESQFRVGFTVDQFQKVTCGIREKFSIFNIDVFDVAVFDFVRSTIMCCIEVHAFRLCRDRGGCYVE